MSVTRCDLCGLPAETRFVAGNLICEECLEILAMRPVDVDAYLAALKEAQKHTVQGCTNCGSHSNMYAPVLLCMACCNLLKNMDDWQQEEAQRIRPVAVFWWRELQAWDVVKGGNE